MTIDNQLLDAQVIQGFQRKKVHTTMEGMIYSALLTFDLFIIVGPSSMT